MTTTDVFTDWHKSSFSAPEKACVEVGNKPGAFGVRDTKDRAGGTLSFDTATWSAFVHSIKAGKLR